MSIMLISWSICAAWVFETPTPRVAAVPAIPAATRPAVDSDSEAVAPAGNPFSRAIATALPSVVKLYGAGIGEERGYGTGVMVSAGGKVVTVESLLLDAANLRVCTPDGHYYTAEVVYRDAYRQLALLKVARHPDNIDTGASLDEQMMPASPVPLKPGSSGQLRRGDWVLTLGNPYRVAQGEEPVSVMKGVVAGRTMLDAEHREQPFPYRGEVILIDAISCNPGSPGSPLVDLDGRWVGLIGRTVTSRFTNTYLNYAYPIEEIQSFLADAESAARSASRPAVLQAAAGYHGIRLSRIGYRKELPFVRSVARGSPAEKAGVRPDDLIISANGVAVPSARVFNELCDRLLAGAELSLVIKRGEQLATIRMSLTEEPE